MRLQEAMSSTESEPAQSSTTGSIKANEIRNSRFLEDIRHEVMVNHLFQQQCANLWLDLENPSDSEGVVLRKSKGTYLTCPPNLIDSFLANACRELNLQVSKKTSGQGED
jgi:hypothetical protein